MRMRKEEGKRGGSYQYQKNTLLAGPERPWIIIYCIWKERTYLGI